MVTNTGHYVIPEVNHTVLIQAFVSLLTFSEDPP